MTLAQIFDINKVVIQISNNKDIELFNQDFINITLEVC